MSTTASTLIFLYIHSVGSPREPPGHSVTAAERLPAIQRCEEAKHHVAERGSGTDVGYGPLVDVELTRESLYRGLNACGVNAYRPRYKFR